MGCVDRRRCAPPAEVPDRHVVVRSDLSAPALSSTEPVHPPPTDAYFTWHRVLRRRILNLHGPCADASYCCELLYSQLRLGLSLTLLLLVRSAPTMRGSKFAGASSCDQSRAQLAHTARRSLWVSTSRETFPSVVPLPPCTALRPFESMVVPTRPPSVAPSARKPSSRAASDGKA